MDSVELFTNPDFATVLVMCDAYAVKGALMGFAAGTNSFHECGSTNQQCKPCCGSCFRCTIALLLHRGVYVVPVSQGHASIPITVSAVTISSEHGGDVLDNRAKCKDGFNNTSAVPYSVPWVKLRRCADVMNSALSTPHPCVPQCTI